MTRKSSVFFLLVAGGLASVALALAHAAQRRVADQAELGRQAQLVRELELTDLCLFPEANYTRHLSQADLHTPFQDYPLSFEHFPAGSLVRPPDGLVQAREPLD